MGQNRSLLLIYHVDVVLLNMSDFKKYYTDFTTIISNACAVTKQVDWV